MFFYNLRIALLSLRRNPILSTVIIGGIALGIAVATLFSTMRHVLAKDPVPERASPSTTSAWTTGTR
jgi:putative ABC transport system permease protein